MFNRKKIIAIGKSPQGMSLIDTVISMAIFGILIAALSDGISLALKAGMTNTSINQWTISMANLSTVLADYEICNGVFQNDKSPTPFYPKNIPAAKPQTLKWHDAEILKVGSRCGDLTVKTIEIINMSKTPFEWHAPDKPNTVYNRYVTRLSISATKGISSFGAPERIQHFYLNILTAPNAHQEEIISCYSGAQADLINLKKEICEEILGTGAFDTTTNTCTGSAAFFKSLLEQNNQGIDLDDLKKQLNNPSQQDEQTAKLLKQLLELFK